MARHESSPTLAAILTVALSAVPGARLQEVAPISGLPAADAHRLVAFLGESVVGKAVQAAVIEDPGRWFPLEPATLTYRVTGGNHKGFTQQHVFRRLDDGPSGTGWSERIGEDQTVFFGHSSEGLTVEGEITHTRDKLTRFSPGEPLIPAGIAPGETREADLDVRVYALTDRDRVRHSGSVRVTCTYLGAFEVRVPSGRYDAALFKWTNHGKVGPASVGETEYRFLARDVGTVAMVVHRDVDAWVVYRSRSKVGKVLTDRDGP